MVRMNIRPTLPEKPRKEGHGRDFLIGVDLGQAKDYTAVSVLERFENPFVEHALSSILLNSVSKFGARLLGSLADSIAATGELPRRLCFALAALLALYRRGPDRRDDPRVLETYDEAWSDYDSTHEGPLTARLLSDRSLWGQDVTTLHAGLVERVAGDLAGILSHGAAEGIERLGRG